MTMGRITDKRIFEPNDYAMYAIIPNNINRYPIIPRGNNSPYASMAYYVEVHVETGEGKMDSGGYLNTPYECHKFASEFIKEMVDKYGEV